MNGIRVFDSLDKAQAEGFAVFDRLPDGYLVRKDIGSHFALALVKLRATSERSLN